MLTSVTLNHGCKNSIFSMINRTARVLVVEHCVTKRLIISEINFLFEKFLFKTSTYTVQIFPVAWCIFKRMRTLVCEEVWSISNREIEQGAVK